MKKVLETPNATAPVAIQTPTTPAQPALWTDAELCPYLSAEPRTVRLWRHTRGLPFIRVTSKIIRYRKGDIDKWLDSRRVQIRGCR